MDHRLACQRRLDARLKAIEDAGVKTPSMVAYLAVPTFERVRYLTTIAADRYGVARPKITGPRGSHRVSLARQEAMYLASLLTQHQCVDLARMFRRHHSSLHHDVHAFARRYGIRFDRHDAVEGVTAALVLEHGGREAVRLHPYLRGDHVEHPARPRPDPCRHRSLAGWSREGVRSPLPGERAFGDAPLEARAEV